MGVTYYPTFTGGTWTLSTTPTTVDGFTRTVVFSNAYRNGSNILSSSGTLDANTRKITVNIAWTDPMGSKSDSLTFYLSNIF